uniref:N-acetyltransferase domain-containing protein n=1 Tax=Globisporangium ultimum (strain ATCC 200006 / CBS 805.95 / DAOM BR144) TaxID=431595 RepID=K3X2W9_GLOUD
RWRISQDAADNSSIAVVTIEHFGILASKRQQGYGTKFLRRIVEDATALVAYVQDTSETALPAV